MKGLIRLGLFLLFLDLLTGHIDYAQQWWRELLSGICIVQIPTCADLQYALDHAPPGATLEFPRGVCVLRAPLILDGATPQLTLRGGAQGGSEVGPGHAAAV